MNSKKILKLSNDELALVVGGMNPPSAKDRLEAFGIGFGGGVLSGPAGVAAGALYCTHGDVIANATGRVLNEEIDIDSSIFKSMGAGMIAGGVTSTAVMVVGAVTVARSLYRKLKSK